MGQGQDKIARSLLDLEPTAIVELFILYFNTVDKPNSFIAFHGGSVFTKGIVWQGIEYLPIPTETDGFEVNANGQLSRPRIRVSNKDYFVTDLLLNNDDLQFAKLIRKRTFIKHLDNINFDGGNPWGQADSTAEISNDTYVIGQKTAENKVFVEFELTSPLDLENFEINNRLIMSRYCSWYYRGNGCNYKGMPIATEDGRKIQINDGQNWSRLGAWGTGIFYASGEAAYIENTKIIVSDPQDTTKTGFAQIWYVSQADHTGSLDKKPDINENFWLKDGCNKKLDGCRLRFGKGFIQYNQREVDQTINYVDFYSRVGTLRYNNITPNAVVSGSLSAATNGISYVNDLKTGNANIEWNGGTAPVVSFEWSEPKTISQIDIYDRIGTTNNFGTAIVRYFNSAGSQIASGRLTVSNDGTRSSSGISPALTVKKITISGSGGAGSARGLAEVAIFESGQPKLIFENSTLQQIHQQNAFQISTWIELTGRSLHPNEIYSVFHNVGAVTGSRYSGINLYLSGQEMMLDFATRTTGQTTVGVSGSSSPKTLILPWRNDELKPLHLICVGGDATGSTPTSSTAGYIRLSDGSQDAFYVLNETQGEYFHFKNSSYQNGMVTGITGLQFGINNWQCSTGNVLPFPNTPSGYIASSLVLYSPIKFGPTAIWTGKSFVQNKINQYSKIPKNYNNISGLSFMTGELFGWWDMEADSTGLIQAENSPSATLKIIADNVDAFQSSATTTSLVSEAIALPKQNITLPFGGFPGTEKYG